MIRVLKPFFSCYSDFTEEAMREKSYVGILT